MNVFTFGVGYKTYLKLGHMKKWIRYMYIKFEKSIWGLDGYMYHHVGSSSCEHVNKSLEAVDGPTQENHFSAFLIIVITFFSHYSKFHILFLLCITIHHIYISLIYISTYIYNVYIVHTLLDTFPSHESIFWFFTYFFLTFTHISIN